MFIPDLQQNLDAVASISILFHTNNDISTAGNVGDRDLALGMIDHARDAINNRNFSPSKAPIIIPNRDVDIKQMLPTLPFGDMQPEDRGDQQRRLAKKRAKDVYASISIVRYSNGSMVVSVDCVEDKDFVLGMLAHARSGIARRVFPQKLVAL